MTNLSLRIIFGAAVIFSAFPVLSGKSAVPVGPVNMTVTSPSFTNMGKIPKVFSCDGSDISPALSWSGAPKGTKSFVLICDDPDAPVGTWIHWVLFNIPSNVTNLAEEMPDKEKYADGTLSGKNSWGKFGYGGPCPPSGTHRYFFKLYALDILLPLKAMASKEQILEAMEWHVVGSGTLIGTFQR